MLAAADVPFLRGSSNTGASALRLRRALEARNAGASVVSPSEALVAALKVVKRDVPLEHKAQQRRSG